MVRPICLSDPGVIREIKQHIRSNSSDLKLGNVVAYALDDEISLGTFTNPADVDAHPLTLERFRDWLIIEYSSIDALNRQWETLFKTVQGDMSLPFTSPGSQFIFDPIGIDYSHAGVQAGWAMDALVHGKTWPSRLSFIDDENQSSDVLRKVWCKSIEDVGLQYDFINYQDVLRGRMDLNDRFKVIILPTGPGQSLLFEFITSGILEFKKTILRLWRSVAGNHLSYF